MVHSHCWNLRELASLHTVLKHVAYDAYVVFAYHIESCRWGKAWAWAACYSSAVKQDACHVVVRLECVVLPCAVVACGACGADTPSYLDPRHSVERAVVDVRS